MSENTANTEILIRYLDGELQGEELEFVEKNIKENPALRDELESLRFARASARRYGLKNRIKVIHSEMMPELKEKEKTLARQGSVRMIFKWVVRVAAVLVVLIGLSVLYQYFTVTPAKLFNESFQSFELRELRDVSQNRLEYQYKNGDVDSVISEFQLLKSPQAEDYLLAGNAFLIRHNPKKAVKCFLSLQEFNKSSDTHHFEEDAEYFLAMSYLANNEPARALPLFEKIRKDPTHAYYKKASGWFMSKLERSISGK